MDESPNPAMASDEQPGIGTEAAGDTQAPAEAAAPGGDRPAGAEQAAEGTGAGEGGAGGTSGSWESGGWRVHDESARDWVGQLQAMIDGVAEHAGPVLREVAAKAAELAAVAAENAGPALQKAATMTTEVGHKVAARSKEYAAELRRQQAEQGAPGETAADQPDTEPGPGA